MLRRHAFIFVLFLLPFSVFFGCPSGQDDIKSTRDDVQSRQDDIELAQGDVQQWQWGLPEGAIRRIGRGDGGEVAFSPDGQYLAASASFPARIVGPAGIYIFDAHTSSMTFKSLIGHTDTVSRVSFSPDGKTLASTSWDKTVRLWDVSIGDTEGVNSNTDPRTVPEMAILTGHSGGVNSVHFSPDGNTIASASQEGTVLLWGVSGFGIPSRQDAIKLAQSDVQRQDAIKLAQSDVHQWGLPEGAVRRIGRNSVGEVAYSPNGQWLAAAGRVPTWIGGPVAILIYDAHTLPARHPEPVKLLIGHTDRVSRVSFSPDGKTLASASWDKTIRLWDVNTGHRDRVILKMATLIGHKGGVNSVSFSPDGKTLASASWDKTVRLWDVNTRKNIKILIGHTDAVESVSFSPDGNTIATGSQDRTVRLWDVNTSRASRLSFRV